MKILILTAAFDGLSQQAYTELVERGHTVAVQSASSDAAMEAAAMRFQPQLIIAPFIKKPIPTDILQQYTVLSVRSGSVTDRGPCTMRGSVTENWHDWSISISQVSKDKDSGEIGTTHTLKIRPEGKRNFFRHHIAQAVVHDILDAVDKLERKVFTFKPKHHHLLTAPLKGRLHSINH